MVHKLIKYSIEEVAMAEKYIRLAKKCDDPAIATKLQEIAKDELRHSDFDYSTAMKLVSKEHRETSNDDDYGDLDKAYFCVYSDWKDKVSYEVDTFEARK